MLKALSSAFSPLSLRIKRRRRRVPSPFLRAASLALIAALFAPAAALLAGAASGDGEALSAAALADYVVQTALYAGCVIVFSLCAALPAAWFTVMRRPPGARFVSWALFMPLALPPYVSGYAYADFFAKRGMEAGGILAAAAVTAAAVYPYIYLFARAALRQQSCHIQSAARLSGWSPLAACRLISWPLARPAVVVGASLALMETLNDIAVAEHYGVRALGLGVYDLWLNRGDLTSACRLALVLMAVVLVLLAMEEHARVKQRHYASQCDRCFACDRAAPISGAKGLLASALLLLPAVAGFFFPLGWFLKIGAQAPAGLWLESFVDGLGGSLFLSAALAVIILALGALQVADRRINSHGALMRPLARLSQCGYALPGAVLAQGFFILAAAAGGGALAGGIGVLLVACSARFFIVAAGALETGMEKISPQLDAAARIAGKSATAMAFRVHLPLLRPAMAAAALMIFLESVKELPMTLILRAHDFQTLAVVAYQYASDEAPELAAPAVMAIAAIGGAAVSALFFLEGRDRRERRD